MRVHFDLEDPVEVLAKGGAGGSLILLPAIAALIRLILEIGKNGYRTLFYNYFDEHTWSKPCLIEHLFR